jgi:hypothetical protein
LLLAREPKIKKHCTRRLNPRRHEELPWGLIPIAHKEPGAEGRAREEDKMHCRLDLYYPAYFAAASSMSIKVAHARHLEIGVIKPHDTFKTDTISIFLNLFRIIFASLLSPRLASSDRCFHSCHLESVILLRASAALHLLGQSGWRL